MSSTLSTSHSNGNRPRKAMRALNWSCFILFFIGMSFQTSPLFAAASADKIKAAYIYQLTQFVTWPNPQESTNTDFTICIFGNESISNELVPLNNRQKGLGLINVRQPKKIQDIEGCHILYIANSKRRQLSSILNRTHEQPTLTVSSIPNFTSNGGGIGFVIKNKKVRIEINRTPPRYAGIKLSAKLLEVASTITSNAQGQRQP